jgi:mRNA interferase MazF
MVRQGYIIWLDFDPQAGYEQIGRRPALVISKDVFSKFSNYAIVCPISNTNKNLAFHVKLDGRTKTTGTILCDQVKSLDISARNYKFIETVPEDIVINVITTVISFMIDKEFIITLNTKG